MTRGDAPLMALLRRLAAMPASDREIVLEALTQSEHERLRLIVKESSQPVLSAGLASLVDECRTGTSPKLTAKAAAALLEAAGAISDLELIDDLLERFAPRRSLLGRVFARDKRAS